MGLLLIKPAEVMLFYAGADNVVPFLGIVLAEAISLSAALLQFGTVGPFIVIALAVLFLHLFAMNPLVPRLIGSRVLIGPVAATVGVLFWGWLWGFMGILLAIPLTAFIKLIADSHPSLIHLANALAEEPKPVPRWVRLGEQTVRRVGPYLRVSRRPTVK